LIWEAVLFCNGQMQIEHIELKNITKRFPGVLACDNINLALKQGEILALLGENGAGKTTLMNSSTGSISRMRGRSSSMAGKPPSTHRSRPGHWG